MIIGGREGTLTERDEEILTDLYFTRLLSTRQIERRYFNTYATTKKRMYELRGKGLIEPATPFSGLTVWTLTRPCFSQEVEYHQREGADHYRGWPKPKAIPHIVDTNDVYMEIGDDLNRVLGEYPEWEWKDEPRAWRRYNHGSESRVHRPDAEIRFGANRYFLERQTERARKTSEKIEEKLEGYRRYTRLLRSSGHEGELEVLFACDAERDMDYALKAAEKYGLAMTAGYTSQIAGHLVEKAEETARTVVR